MPTGTRQFGASTAGVNRKTGRRSFDIVRRAAADARPGSGSGAHRCHVACFSCYLQAHIRRSRAASPSPRPKDGSVTKGRVRRNNGNLIVARGIKAAAENQQCVPLTSVVVSRPATPPRKPPRRKTRAADRPALPPSDAAPYACSLPKTSGRLQDWRLCGYSATCANLEPTQHVELKTCHQSRFSVTSSRDLAEPSVPAKKRLFALSSNPCAFPGCPAALIAGETVVAKICHIKGARPAALAMTLSKAPSSAAVSTT